MTKPIAQYPADVNVSGRWEHCSPELLSAGINCSTTPRRPCECAHGVSHDHFISDDRLEIETFDANGKRVQWGIGPTQAELEAAHLSGECHAFCAYCITEAEALTAAALRTTTDVAADVPPPSSSRDGLTKGWLPIAERSDYPRVEPACSSSVYHGRGQQNKTTSQGARSLYSTKLLALKALRRAVEKHCADRLRAVDRMIEAESSNV